MLPCARELVLIRAAVADAAVLHVAEVHADRKTAGQDLVEPRIVARRRAVDVGGEYVRRVRRAVAAAQIEPLVAALRRAAEDAEPPRIERDAEVRHRDVLMKFAI